MSFGVGDSVGIGSVFGSSTIPAPSIPSDITISSDSILEGSPIGSTVGTFSTTDGTSPYTYTLVAGTGDTDNSSFGISGSNLITAAAVTAFGSPYSIRVRTTDASSFTYDEVFSITVVALELEGLAPIAPTVITDPLPEVELYSAMLLDLLMEQYVDKPVFEQIVNTIGLLADDVETALREIRDNYWLSTAVGVQLNVLGDIFVVERLGRDDDAYRAAIIAQAASIFSGTPESVINALITLYGATYVTFKNNGDFGHPALFTVETDATVRVEELEYFAVSGVAVNIENNSTQGYLITELDEVITAEDGTFIYTEAY